MSPARIFKNVVRKRGYFARSVTTWSPLATSFNSKPAQGSIFKSKEGIFRIPQLRDPSGFYLLKEGAVGECSSLLDECFAEDRKRKLVEVFDSLSNSLCKVADMAEFVRVAHPNQSYSQAAEDACLSISQLVEQLNTNRQLYLSLKNAVESGDKFPTDPVDDHVGRLFLFDFEQSGIHLDDKSRANVVYLNDLALYTGQQFASNATRPTSVHAEQLPEGIRSFFPREGDHLLVTGLFSDASSELAREAAYRIYLHPNPKQDELLVNLLTARHELAKACGFPSFAHRALQGSLAETPELVAKFLEDLAEKLGPRAERDFSQMTKMKGSPVQVWDPPYFTHVAKKSLLNVRQSDFLPYFSLGTCMDGLNLLTQTLFGIELVAEDMAAGEGWDPDIHKIAVMHHREGKLGYVYCDFYERQGKPHQDCHFTIQGGKEMPNGEYQNPIVVLMLNFPSPTPSQPSLLSPSMVDNLFHEMGHALHSMMARTRYQHVTGTRCTTDFAEVPSILMEHFASDPRVVAKFARHFQTGESMPDDLREKYCLAKHVFSASDMQLQNFYSALDQNLHTTNYPLTRPTIKILEEAHQNFYGLPYVENTAWHLRFGHLVGYGSKYFSYLIARAISSWIWQEYFHDDPFNTSHGEKYRRELLAHGGGVPARKLVSEFLGKSVTASNLSQSLITDIDEHHKRLASLRD